MKNHPSATTSRHGRTAGRDAFALTGAASLRRRRNLARALAKQALTRHDAICPRVGGVACGAGARATSAPQIKTRSSLHAFAVARKTLALATAGGAGFRLGGGLRRGGWPDGKFHGGLRLGRGPGGRLGRVATDAHALSRAFAPKANAPVGETPRAVARRAHARRFAHEARLHARARRRFPDVTTRKKPRGHHRGDAKHFHLTPQVAPP